MNRSEDRTLLYLFVRLMLVITIIGIPAGVLIGRGVAFFLLNCDPRYTALGLFVIGGIHGFAICKYWRSS